MQQEGPGIPIIVAIVGATSGLTPGQAQRLRELVSGLLKHLRRSLRHSAIEIIAALETEDVCLAADVFAASGCKVWATPSTLANSQHVFASNILELPADFCGLNTSNAGDDCLVEALCRYAHLLIDIAPEQSGTPGLRERVVKAWRERAFHYGDELADDEQLALLEPPSSGAIIVLALPTRHAGADRKATSWKAGWSWQSNRAADGVDHSSIAARQGVAALQRFDRFNRDLHSVNATTALARAENLLPRAELMKIGALDSVEPVRALFGQASAVARAAKRVCDRFNVLYAATPALAVISYEIGRANFGENTGLWLYVVFLGALILAAVIIRGRRDQEKLLETRVLAELLRAQLFWRLAGVTARLETSLRRWLPGAMPNLEAATRAIDFLLATAGAPGNTNLSFAAEHWIGASANPNDSVATSQIHWHGAQSDLYRRRIKWMEAAQFGVFVFAFLLAIVPIAIGAVGPIPGLNVPIEAAAIAGLPALAGGLAILRERFALRSLSDNYARIHRLSLSARRKLDAASARSDQGEMLRIVEQFGRETIRESIEWMQTHRLRRIDPRGL